MREWVCGVAQWSFLRCVTEGEAVGVNVAPRG